MLGDEAEARETAGRCSYHEVTLVEELDAAGAVKGSEERTYDGELDGVTVSRRDKKSVTAKGAALADLLVEPKGAKGRKPARSPFHPAQRPQFRFELREGPSPGLARVTLEPLKPDAERPRGEAWVRSSDGRINARRTNRNDAPARRQSPPAIRKASRYCPVVVRMAPAPKAASDAPSWWLAPIHP